MGPFGNLQKTERVKLDFGLKEQLWEYMRTKLWETPKNPTTNPTTFCSTHQFQQWRWV